jgi:hypothetical protein
VHVVIVIGGLSFGTVTSINLKTDAAINGQKFRCVYGPEDLFRFHRISSLDPILDQFAPIHFHILIVTHFCTIRSIEVKPHAVLCLGTLWTWAVIYRLITSPV